MSLDDIVSVSISVSAGKTVNYGFGMPVLAAAPPRDRHRVRVYQHWTQMALAGFGTESMKLKAQRWLKRRARMLRKKRRGWA